MPIADQYPIIDPSLLLDFANVKKLDPRITFTRAATAVYYNGVTTAKAEENLFTYSEQFDNAIWTKADYTITANATTAPDGNTTADLAIPNTVNNSKAVRQAFSVTNGLAYAYSIYVKAGGYNFFQIANSTGFLLSSYTNFNLSTGAIGNTTGDMNASIVSVGNGWYRCSVVVTATSTGSAQFLSTALTADTASRSPSFAGDNTSGVYLWGAQVEQRSAVTAYTPTTTQAITNYIPALQTAASGEARFDHNPITGESLGLLIEESRANLLTYSQAFDDASWSKTRVNLTTAAGVAPDGTLTAARLYEDTTANNSHSLIKAFSAAASTTYTFSVYLKAAGRNYANIQIGNFGNQIASNPIYVDLSAGTIVSASDYSRCSITLVGNGWYRVTVTVTTIPSAVALSPSIYITQSGSNQTSVTADGWSGVLVWGAQLEAGSFATSYIPTVASQVTRAADAASMTGANFSSWYRADEGTIYTEFKANAASVGQSFASIDDGTTGNAIYLITSPSNSVFDRFQVNVGGATQAAIGTSGFIATNQNKMAGAYKVNDFERAINGASLTDTLGTVPVVNTLRLGNQAGASFLNGTIKKLAYYPKRLTNTQLQALTL